MSSTIKFLFSKLIKKAKLASIKNSTIHKTSKIEAGTSFYNSTMQKHSFCGYDCDISNTEIGSFTSIANNVVIGGGMHPMNWAGMSPVFYKGRDSVKKKFSKFKREPIQKVIIGNDVWIGRNVLVKQGVTISHGAVIGMGSVVTKNVPPYSIFGGIPAKKIRDRFEKDMIEELLKIEWWSFNEDKLKQAARFIKDPKKFIKALKK